MPCTPQTVYAKVRRLPLRCSVLWWSRSKTLLSTAREVMRTVQYREDNDERLRAGVLDLCTTFAEEWQARRTIQDVFEDSTRFKYSGSQVGVAGSPS